MAGWRGRPDTGAGGGTWGEERGGGDGGAGAVTGAAGWPASPSFRRFRASLYTRAETNDQEFKRQKTYL